ncbi:hypothetical protein MMC14_009193 [Varicellaria rhodocarpa]|nr:hypothetical protein [Varicellaria rhodocarpa]
MDTYPRKRQRAGKACRPCRQLKRKCNGEKPCSTCIRFQHECLYQESKEKTLEGVVTSGSGTSTSNITAPTEAMQYVHDKEKNDHNILDPERGRYFDSSSAVAFPRLVGMQLGANKAPRLHSFAWNLGVRSEPMPNTLDITKFISLNDVYLYSSQYFKVVNPVFEILDQQEFLRRASLRYTGNAPEEALNYDAVICGAVALGSFCSQPSDNSIEASLTAFAKERLESVGLTKLPTIDLIAAWILRTIYLRATSRPQASWIASNTLMHLIEASGLHRELSSICIIYPSPNNGNIDQVQILYRRKLFWIGRAVNAIFSYEYSRPRIITNKISCERIDSDVDSATSDLLRLADLIPQNTQACDDEMDISGTKAMLESIRGFSTLKAPVSLMATDIAFAAYRHLRPFITPGSPSIEATISHILSIGSAALLTIHEHLSGGAASCHSMQSESIIPWWSLALIPFHYILILLSLDTQDCLARVSHALQTLQEVASVFNTHLTREAVQNATMLIRLSQSRKEADAQVLRQALNEVGQTKSISTVRTQSMQRRAAEQSSNLGTGSDSTGGGRVSNQPIQQDVDRNNTAENISGGLDMDDNGNGGYVDLGINPNQFLSDGLTLDWNALFDNLDWI